MHRNTYLFFFKTRFVYIIVKAVVIKNVKQQFSQIVAIIPF